MNIEKILDEQEIVPVFQPIVTLKNCDILGYEICSHLNDKPIIISRKSGQKIPKKTK